MLLCLSQHRACEGYPISSRISLVSIYSQLDILRRLDRYSHPFHRRQG